MLSPIYLWATRIRWLFSIYLPIFLLWLYRRVVWRLQKVSSSVVVILTFLFTLLVPDVYIMFLRKYGPKPFSLVIFISLSNTGHAPNIGFVFTNFLSHKGYYLNITTVGTEQVQDSCECAFKCLEKDPCLSFNLADLDDNIDNLLCELLPSDHYTHSDKFITNHLWYHHSIAVKLVILSSRFFFHNILIITKTSWNCLRKVYSNFQR